LIALPGEDAAGDDATPIVDLARESAALVPVADPESDADGDIDDGIVGVDGTRSLHNLAVIHGECETVEDAGVPSVIPKLVDKGGARFPLPVEQSVLLSSSHDASPVGGIIVSVPPLMSGADHTHVANAYTSCSHVNEMASVPPYVPEVDDADATLDAAGGLSSTVDPMDGVVAFVNAADALPPTAGSETSDDGFGPATDAVVPAGDEAVSSATGTGDIDTAVENAVAVSSSSPDVAKDTIAIAAFATLADAVGGVDGVAVDVGGPAHVVAVDYSGPTTTSAVEARGPTVVIDENEALTFTDIIDGGASSKNDIITLTDVFSSKAGEVRVALADTASDLLRVAKGLGTVDDTACANSILPVTSLTSLDLVDLDANLDDLALDAIETDFAGTIDEGPDAGADDVAAKCSEGDVALIVEVCAIRSTVDENRGFRSSPIEDMASSIVAITKVAGDLPPTAELAKDVVASTDCDGEFSSTDGGFGHSVDEKSGHHSTASSPALVPPTPRPPPEPPPAFDGGRHSSTAFSSALVPPTPRPPPEPPPAFDDSRHSSTAFSSALVPPMPRPPPEPPPAFYGGRHPLTASSPSLVPPVSRPPPVSPSALDGSRHSLTAVSPSLVPLLRPSAIPAAETHDAVVTVDESGTLSSSATGADEAIVVAAAIAAPEGAGGGEDDVAVESGEDDATHTIENGDITTVGDKHGALSSLTFDVIGAACGISTAIEKSGDLSTSAVVAVEAIGVAAVGAAIDGDGDGESDVVIEGNAPFKSAVGVVEHTITTATPAVLDGDDRGTRDVAIEGSEDVAAPTIEACATPFAVDGDRGVPTSQIDDMGSFFVDTTGVTRDLPSTIESARSVAAFTDCDGEFSTTADDVRATVDESSHHPSTAFSPPLVPPVSRPPTEPPPTLDGDRLPSVRATVDESSHHPSTAFSPPLEPPVPRPPLLVPPVSRPPTEPPPTLDGGRQPSTAFSPSLRPPVPRPPPEPPPVLDITDNLSNMRVTTNSGSSARSRHFLIRYECLKTRQANGECDVLFTHDPSMPTDSLTKWVSAVKASASIGDAKGERPS